MTPRTWAYGDSDSGDQGDGGDGLAVDPEPARDRTYESFGRQGVALPTYGDEPRAHRGSERVDLGEPVANPVAPASRTGTGPRGWQRRDHRIHDDVCAHLTDDGYVDVSEVEVVVHQGEVILTGTVADRRQHDRAIRIAELTRGVVGVISRVRIVTELPEPSTPPR